MELFAVKVNRDDTVSVVSVTVKSETAQNYVLPRVGWEEPGHDAISAYGFRTRIAKSQAHTTARAALEAYMKRRQEDKANAQCVIGQATKQIASANELLMHLPSAESESSS